MNSKSTYLRVKCANSTKSPSIVRSQFRESIHPVSPTSGNTEVAGVGAPSAGTNTPVTTTVVRKDRPVEVTRAVVGPLETAAAADFDGPLALDIENDESRIEYERVVTGKTTPKVAVSVRSSGASTSNPSFTTVPPVRSHSRTTESEVASYIYSQLPAEFAIGYLNTRLILSH